MDVDRPPTRECGGCTACCSAVGVSELKKMPGVGCRYENKGAGCTVYDQRPPSCASFRCLWLDDRTGGELTRDEERPDVCGVVITGSGGETPTLADARPKRPPLLQAFEAWEGAFDTYRAQKVLARVAKRAIVCLIRYGDLRWQGKDRKVIGPKNFAHFFAKAEAAAIANAKSEWEVHKEWREGIRIEDMPKVIMIEAGKVPVLNPKAT